MTSIIKKTQFQLTLFIASLFLSVNTNAQDILGSEFSYQCVGANSYQITYYYYFNCNNTGIPATIDLDWTGVCGSGTETLNQISVIDVTPICFSGQSSCNGGTGSYGVERVHYSGTVNLPGGCTDITFSNDYSNRQAVSNNVGGAQLLYVENTVDNTVAPCNSSPQFLNQPVMYTLVNGSTSYSNEAFDPDGDSLVYLIVAAQTASSTSVIYNPGYTAANPFGIAIPYSINSSNGTIIHTGAVPTGKTVLAIRVDEYRAGVKIGSVTRDWTIEHLSTPNANKPVITGFNGGSQFTDTICPFNTSNYCVPITITDADAGDNINFIILNDSASNFNFNFTGTNPVTVNVCWNSSKPMLAGTYYFSLEAEDDACPLPLKADEQFYSVTIKPQGMSTDVHTECDSLAWMDGNTYYASNNTAQFIISGGSANGCDSIVNLDLTIDSAAQGTDTQVACDTYTWINGMTYLTDNNTAKDTIPNGASTGCDSIVTLNLTINTVDVTLTSNNDSITANATGATYQWLDCGNNFSVISGETSQLFVASSSGNYAVQVTQNGCTDTSDCANVSIIGLEDLKTVDNYRVYPNPTSGVLTIALEKMEKNLNYELITIEGKVILNGKLNRLVNPINISSEANGIYFLKITGVESSYVHKVVKQ